MGKRKTRDDFLSEVSEIHGVKYSHDKVRYLNAHKLVTITCPVHGGFPQLSTNHLSGSGCFYCKASHLETETRILLEQNNITFISQKKFNWLKSHKNGSMPLDFYLPNYNIGVECHGIQHYKEMACSLMKGPITQWNLMSWKQGFARSMV